MKKAALILMILLSASGLYGQECVKDTTIKDSGIYPKSIDSAWADSTYEQVLQILAVKDTTVVVSGNSISVVIDSIRIDSIVGLPSSFTYACEPMNCVYTHDSVGCAVLRGSPTHSDVGEHPLQIFITSFAKWGSIELSQGDTLQDFTLVVLDSNFSSLEDLNLGIKVYPNPSADGQLNLKTDFSLNELHVYDNQGKIVYSKVFTVSTTQQQVKTQLEAGLYVVRVKTEGGTFFKKWVILN